MAANNSSDIDSPMNIRKIIPDKSQSVKHFKRLTSYLVSSIVYLRKFFREDCFTIVEYETCKFRILSNDSKNANVHQLIKYLKSCYQALENNYLKSITMGVFEMVNGKMSKNPIEKYTFDYDYGKIEMFEKSKKHYSSKLPKTENFKSQANQIMRELFDSLKSMQELPKSDYYLIFKLKYLDEFSPNDVALEGFKPYNESSSSKTSFSIVNEAHKFACSSLSTNYHAMNVQIEAHRANIIKDQVLPIKRKQMEANNEENNEFLKRRHVGKTNKKKN